MIIKIKDLEIQCNIGIYDWEKTYDRKLVINLEMHLNSQKVIQTQNINDTIDYELIYNNIKKIVHSKYYELLEVLASDILDMVLQHELISFAIIEIDKIKIYNDVKSCAIVLQKHKK